MKDAAGSSGATGLVEPTRREQFLQLRQSSPVILPSMLRCDFGNLRHEVGQLVAANALALHLDIMDGHFVPNITYGMPIVRALHASCNLPLDVHLMMGNAERYLEEFYRAGAYAMTVHIEAVADPRSVLTSIREMGASAGIALNPETPVSALESCVGCCDMVLVMSVDPGFGGQAFDESALTKVKQVKEMFGPEICCEMDGGINRDTIGRCVAAGVEMLVVGSAIFGQGDYARALAELHRDATLS
jgi:ribulose-phosphate 3-epimerase